MKKLLYPLKVLWAYWYFFIFSLIFLIFLPAFVILLSREKWYPAANRLRVIWGYILFFFTGIILRVRFNEKLDRRQPYIFCANHFSYLDIPVSALVVKRNWCYMAKLEISHIPIINIFFGTLDIAVDRESKRESFKAMREASDNLDKGRNIVVYPEGTITAHPPKMVRFKNGPFRLAIEKQIPIVPLTMLDNWRLLFVDGWKMHGRPGVANVIVHAPIPTTGMTLDDMDSLKERVFNLLENDLINHHAQKQN
ncbi:MAG: 1-acyl-sn-glycerol-3-phosphate acyltransferase [Chitinophagales bacterium]